MGRKGTPKDTRPGKQRYWARTEMPSGENICEQCWKWIGYINPSTGYGQITVNGQSHVAYRFGYEMLFGTVPEGLELDHLCRNRWCVNPHHLEPVTRQVNSHRGESFCGRNARKAHCPQGHPYTPENTYFCPKGRRECRTCRQVASAKRRSDASLSRDAAAA